MSENNMPPAMIIMGVAGSGKTTVGEMLGKRLGWEFRDADSFHPAANIAKMSAGTPLTDEDRWPWLDAIKTWVDAHRRAGTHGVATCSALKRAYRDRLRGGRDDMLIAHLQGSFERISARMAQRQHHFMPTALLKSQFDTLESPTPDEHVLVVSVEEAPEQIIEAIIAALPKRA